MAFNFPSQTAKSYLQTINPSAPDAGAALKVLSLNLPGFLGGAPIAPDALLRPGLGINAQVGGTPAPAPVAAPAAAPAGQSAALAGLSAQLGSPDLAPAPQPGPPSSTVSPFTSAPIAALASNALGGSNDAAQTNNFAPPQNPGLPAIEFHGAPRSDVFGGGPTVPAPAPAASTDALMQLLTTLFQPSGGGSDVTPDQGPQMI